MRPACIRALAVLTAIASASPAHAQTAAEQNANTETHGAFNAGVAALNSKNYDEALQQFTLAAERRPTLRFLRSKMATPRAGPDFLLMHHVLWWAHDAPWWTEVHPILTASGARAVFSGDLGPTMYTHLRRDGVEYFRSIVNADVDNPLAGDPHAAGKIIPSLQFETFLHVTVDGPTVEYHVEPIGTLTSPAFTPERWQDAFGREPDPGRYYDPATFRPDSARAAAAKRPPPPPASLLGRFWEAFGSPRRLALLAVVAALAVAAGLALGRTRRSDGRSAA
jgi:hypothetical protein